MPLFKSRKSVSAFEALRADFDALPQKTREDIAGDLRDAWTLLGSALRGLGTMANHKTHVGRIAPKLLKHLMLSRKGIDGMCSEIEPYFPALAQAIRELGL